MDCALSLVRLGREREIPGLEVLCDNLITMETLVYETSCELSLTLKDLQQLSDIDKLRLLMKNVSGIIYIFNCSHFMCSPAKVLFYFEISYWCEINILHITNLMREELIICLRNVILTMHFTDVSWSLLCYISFTF